MLTVHSPIFFRKIVDIERFALPAAILDECQIYLGGGGQSLASLKPDAQPLGTYETKMATRTGKCSILTIFMKKKGVCEHSSLESMLPLKGGGGLHSGVML